MASNRFLSSSNVPVSSTARDHRPEETFRIPSELVPAISNADRNIACKSQETLSRSRRLHVDASRSASPPKVSDAVSKLSNFTGRFKSNFLKTADAALAQPQVGMDRGALRHGKPIISTDWWVDRDVLCSMSIQDFYRRPGIPNGKPNLTGPR
jgi:hypothetical protein